MGADSLNAVLTPFLQHLRTERGLADNTLLAYTSDLTRYLHFIKREKGLESIDHHTLNSIVKADIEAYLCLLADMPEIESDFTTARNISALRNFHNFWLQEEVVTHNPAELIDFPRLHRSLPTVLSEAEVLALIEAYNDADPLSLRNRAALELLYSSGLRVSELTSLPISMLYFDEGFVRIMGKGDKERLVPMGEHAIFWLKRYLEEARPALSPTPKASGICFINRRGGTITRNMLFYIVRDAARIANIPKTVSPHTLRHSFATHLIERGADLIAVRDMLGHTSISTTEVYVHLNARFLRDVIAQHHPRK